MRGVNYRIIPSWRRTVGQRMNDPARKKPSMQSKLMLASKMRHKDGVAFTALRSSCEDRGRRSTRTKCNEIFLPVEANEEDAVRKSDKDESKLRCKYNNEGDTSATRPQANTKKKNKKKKKNRCSKTAATVTNKLSHRRWNDASHTPFKAQNFVEDSGWLPVHPLTPF